MTILSENIYVKLCLTAHLKKKRIGFGFASFDCRRIPYSIWAGRPNFVFLNCLSAALRPPAVNDRSVRLGWSLCKPDPSALVTHLHKAANTDRRGRVYPDDPWAKIGPPNSNAALGVGWPRCRLPTSVAPPKAIGLDALHKLPRYRLCGSPNRARRAHHAIAFMAHKAKNYRWVVSCKRSNNKSNRYFLILFPRKF